MKGYFPVLLAILLAGCVESGESYRTDFTGFLEENMGKSVDLYGFFTDFNPYGADRCNGIKYFFYVNCSKLGFICGRSKYRPEAYIPVIGELNAETGKSMWIKAKIIRKNITCVDYYVERTFPFRRKGRTITIKDIAIIVDDTYCRSDDDCACGTHIVSGECFAGNRLFVDESRQCPDFCTGIAGNLRTKCVENRCVIAG